MLIEIKNRFNGAVIFSHDVAANTVALTLVAALAARADLRAADLREANLREADLYGADLRGANLRGANLREADLYGANLREANLYGANLREANLRGADLYGADLYGADLQGANLQGANLPAFSHIPDEGPFIAYKKLQNGVVAKLEIPAEAKRTSSLVGRKNRAEFIRVLELSNGAESELGAYDGKTVYKVGELVYPDKYDEDIRVECTHGIHFFITRKEAEDY